MVTATFPIVWRDSPDASKYEALRTGRIFNGIKPPRYPRAIIEASTHAHVVQAVRLANVHACKISVRSGGHSWAAWSLRDDAMLICLKNLQEIDLDESAGIVKVSPSTTGRMLNTVLGKHSLMFAGGHCPDVGLGGFLLQGGMGWNCKVRQPLDFLYRIEIMPRNFGHLCYKLRSTTSRMSEYTPGHLVSLEIHCV
jgi:FAD/FMN-containing dehydrogenase